MNVTLDLKPEIQAGLMAQAQSSSKTLEEYLVSMLEGAVESVQVVMTAEQRAAEFEAGRPAIVPLLPYQTTRSAPTPSMMSATADEYFA
jgi:hypothetical protein